MQQIKIDIYDLFGNLIPGSLLLITGWVLCDRSIEGIDSFTSSVSKFDGKLAIIFGLFAYALGVAITHLGAYLYKNINKIFKYTDDKDRQVTTENWILIREYAEKHLAIIERYSLLKTTSQNFFVVSLFSSVFSLLKLWTLDVLRIEWIAISILFFILARLFFLRSRHFAKYRDGDILCTIKLLDLERHIQKP